ncbi:MAG: preprotein translocase subunit YajC [Burkholderiaceae bacterium]|jgi:preprotein translocase subunit YajC|nr:MAG: preprotein translocase subunit YajC [Burkholderiaceae bacterium]TAM09251.1 MAG: preprotein translocase subunit YajC [Pusillimonas sp.]
MSPINTLELVTAQASAGGEGNALMGMLPIILMFVILYFLMIRPQMKRQKDHKSMVAALSKGDEIITTGGMLGKVTKVSDNYITAEITQSDKPIEIILQRTAVTSVLPKGTIKAL